MSLGGFFLFATQCCSSGFNNFFHEILTTFSAFNPPPPQKKKKKSSCASEALSAFAHKTFPLPFLPQKLFWENGKKSAKSLSPLRFSRSGGKRAEILVEKALREKPLLTVVAQLTGGGLRGGWRCDDRHEHGHQRQLPHVASDFFGTNQSGDYFLATQTSLASISAVLSKFVPSASRHLCRIDTLFLLSLSPNIVLERKKQRDSLGVSRPTEREQRGDSLFSRKFLFSLKEENVSSVVSTNICK